ncbi:30S ribosome-binding factor RbfA [Blochmannia endosymbiont of Colobopsis nipponica]|uniref:30S ribosome-binding factor RbfA n=1 Tax=Blochmannia endosymbiont of Colobopsis nipponica TaxID=2681987 RepID=UPI00177E6E22|nr:30S ribosome-binding factor RbfA [Blochmannia endosymbiont of Colobopsis nipponica]QOI10753.1 30S ribosome-binding factor RbfA [Blochmannia endosymbiont of Colobopsis nipponica]
MLISKCIRLNRFSKEIKKNISIILHRSINDCRIGVVTVSGVDISRDLAYAKIYVTFLDKNKEVEIRNGVCVLQSASGFIRCLLSRFMRLRIVPKLVFIYDQSLIEGMRMCSLITRVVKRDMDLHNGFIDGNNGLFR